MMKLTRVTITGADDGVAPVALSRLSEEFPFVEWGILLSTKRAGTPRYPSVEWLAELAASWVRLHMRFGSIKLSAHVCGELSRDLQKGACPPLLKQAAFMFDRAQVNGWDSEERFHFTPNEAFRGMEFILQVKTIDVLRVAGRLSHSILYDPSGGRGESPDFWPPIHPYLKMGYAGGITPENVEDVLRKLVSLDSEDTGAVRPFWIDMESGVRTGDNFDLVKVRRVLERCRSWIVL